MSPCRILVVEDHPTQRELLRAFLELNGFAVREAATGRDALAMLDDFRPDLLVTDHVMPGMDGMELIRRIRASRRWRHLPILLCTGAEQERRPRLEEGDGVHLVAKPVGCDALAALVREILGTPRGTGGRRRDGAG